MVAIFNLSYTTTNEVTTSYYHIGTYEPNLQLKDDVYYTLLPMNPLEYVYSVALNKPAQIKRNIEELTVLRKRVQALEDFYDQIALEQAHQLSLINHSIELDYDI